MPRALLSVSDKSGLVEFAQRAGAPRFRAGLHRRHGADAPARQACRSSASPSHRFPRDDGRPRQDAAPARARRHPRAAIAAGRSRGDPRTASRPIDLVVVNLYPFVKAAPNPDTPFDALIEEIDIGGPSLVRAAAKNFARRARRRVAGRLRTRARAARSRGRTAPSFRFELARKAFAHTGALRHARSPPRWLGHGTTTPGSRVWRRAGFPQPDARAPQGARSSLRREPASARRALRRVRRRILGTRDAAGQGAVVHEPARSRCRRPHRARVQRAGRRGHQAHQSVRRRHRIERGRRLRARARCRFALGVRAASSALNRPIDAETARAIVSTLIEAVIAPAVDDEARAILATKAEHARRRARRAAADAVRQRRPGISSCARSSAACWCRVATSSREAQEPWPAADLQRGDASGSRRQTSGRRCALPGASART